KNDNIINIALFGVDKRGAGTGRSDSIMIATLDKEHGKIKLTSLLRDLYVEIPGRGMDKLNHAYAYGGPELTIKTINHNFNMNIRDFATVDFDSFEKIIDILGGIEIAIQPNEVRYVPGSKAGKQVLDGKQALAYSRIRKVGTDYARTERQRTVMEGLIRKGISAGITKYPGLLNAVLPYVDTSLTKTETLSLGTSALTSGIKDIEQFRIPVDGHAKSQMINGVSYEVPDTLEDNVEFLHKFIYEDESEIETDLGADE
ncbi:MAG: LCP family protein, partial [Tissierellaceae bacterium]